MGTTERVSDGGPLAAEGRPTGLLPDAYKLGATSIAQQLFYGHSAGGIGTYTRSAVPQGSSVSYWHAALCFAQKQAVGPAYRDRVLWSPHQTNRGHYL